MRTRSEGGFPSDDSSSSIKPEDFEIDSCFFSAEQQLEKAPLVFFSIPDTLLTKPTLKNQKLEDRFKRDFIDGELEHRDIQLKQDIRILEKQIIDMLNDSREVEKLNEQLKRKSQQLYIFEEQLNKHIKQMDKKNEGLVTQKQKEEKKPLRNPKKSHDATKLQIKKELQLKRSGLEDKNKALEEERDSLKQRKANLQRKITEIEKKTEEQTQAKKRNWLKQQFIAEKVAQQQLKKYIEKYKQTLNANK